MSEIQPIKKKKKLVNNRRKSRELVMKSIYRGILNQFDINQIKKDIKDDPDYLKADEVFYGDLFDGVISHIDQLNDEISIFIDRPISKLSPIEHSILYIAVYELIYNASIPYRVAINEGVELAKTFGGVEGYKYINGVLDKVAEKRRPLEFSKN
ncbi:MAG: transcription antitermination factor NusB [Candidatus Methylopumilus sp.]|nr:transcription antitermination factor NusB [Candidatus Methylopumilus sp.]